MINKDGQLIYNSLKNWIQLYIWGWEWIDNLTNFDYLKYDHLWPDLIWISEVKIYWIEHFYVDSSNKNRKWNALKIEYSKEIRENIISKIEKELISKDISTQNYKFKSNLSYENLKKNIYSNFETHYNNINEYNKNITEEYWKDKEIEIIFFIELNVLPSYYLVKWKPEKPFIAFNDINFLKYFSDKKNIKWIIFNTNNKNYYIPVKDKYTVDNINIFDFSDWEIEDLVMNQITSWIKV
jgi:hypothetical protein